MKILISFSLFSLLLISCVTQKPKTSLVKKWIDSTQIESNSFVGIKIFDPKTKEVIFTKNEKRYFVPASNTKILSLYASLKNLGDSIPALKYLLKNDSLFVSGTADPTFLHPDLPKSKTYDFIKNSTAKTIIFSNENFKNEVYGSGWAWATGAASSGRSSKLMAPSACGAACFGRGLSSGRSSKLITPESMPMDYLTGTSCRPCFTYLTPPTITEPPSGNAAN